MEYQGKNPSTCERDSYPQWSEKKVDNSVYITDIDKNDSNTGTNSTVVDNYDIDESDLKKDIYLSAHNESFVKAESPASSVDMEKEPFTPETTPEKEQKAAPWCDDEALPHGKLIIRLPDENESEESAENWTNQAKEQDWKQADDDTWNDASSVEQYASSC